MTKPVQVQTSPGRKRRNSDDKFEDLLLLHQAIPAEANHSKHFKTNVAQ